MNENNEITKESFSIISSPTDWIYLKKMFNLSQREMEIAILICKAFSVDKIARLLIISPRTVSTHLRSLYIKTKVHDKTLFIFTLLKALKERDNGN
jgi:DNA-binding CsgD family transcriptional regulator